jgi:ankyrin repeat protein
MDMSRFTAGFSLLIVFLCAYIMLSADRICAAELSNSLLGAAELGEIDKVKGLLDQGVPVDAKDDDGWTALMKATYEGHRHIVQELIVRGASVDTRENAGWTSLMMTAQFGYHDIMDVLLTSAAKVNVRNNTGGP